MVSYGFLWFPMVSYGFLWFPHLVIAITEPCPHLQGSMGGARAGVPHRSPLPGGQAERPGGPGGPL